MRTHPAFLLFLCACATTESQSPPDASTATDAGVAMDSHATDAPGLLDTLEASRDAGKETSIRCAVTQKACNETCVSLSDPAYGCKPTGCDPCPSSDGGTVSCDERSACQITCPASTHLCGTSCVGSTADHCGLLCSPCPAPTNGSAVCQSDACAIACDAGFVPCLSGCCNPDAATLPTGTLVSASDHTCGITPQGGIKCWGYNYDGQLGDNTQTQSNVPVEVTGLTAGISSISAGNTHTCALTTFGGLKCWGDNIWGQLGRGDKVASRVPIDVPAFPFGVAEVSAGDGYTCVRKTSGHTQCWGSNFNGELGNGGTSESLLPADVTGLTDAVSISAGQFHACAVVASGQVRCWGRNDLGQLGANVGASANTPQGVSGVAGATQVACGFKHSCALISGGIKCWGSGSSGQLGNGNTNDSLTPVSVVGLSNVTALDARGDTTCALSGSTLHCWGAGIEGQLGNNSSSDSAVPVAVGGTVLAFGLGRVHVCALVAGSGAQCWGNNAYGQLGNNSTTSSPVPTAVTNFP